MAIFFRHIFHYSWRWSLVASAIVLSSNNLVKCQNQVSPLQQPAPSNNQSQPNNIIQSLFSNSGAASYANSLASPNSNSPYASVGGVPAIPDNFWGNQFHRHTVDAGTVLNGIIEEELSSKKSHVGDVFSILLSNGYASNTEQLIPLNAKILGAVVAVTPASKMKNGIPGSIQISLQTLALPDGSIMPINAAIQYNPNQPNNLNIKKGRGIPLGEYAQSAQYSGISAVGALGRQFGIPLPIGNQTGGGADFIIKKGELLPVKLTQPLDMSAYATSLSTQPSSTQTSGPVFRLPASASQTPAAPNIPANNSPMPVFNNPFGAPNNNLPQSGNANSSYPSGWPGNQTLPQSTNILPGNNEPAGPEPF